MFQSLIGRLKTILIDFTEEPPVEFQSLIGRLKTIVLDLILHNPRMFQSLIGRLKTDYRANNDTSRK